MAECSVGDCGVSSSMDESGMSAAAAHLSDSSGMSSAAAHSPESSDLSAPLPWCSSQCLRAKSARSLSVSIFGFAFLPLVFSFHVLLVFSALALTLVERKFHTRPTAHICFLSLSWSQFCFWMHVSCSSYLGNWFGGGLHCC